MLGNLTRWLKALSLGKKIALGAATLVTATAVASPTPSPSQNTPSVERPKSSVLQEATPKVEKQTVTETSSIPFQKTTIQDASLEKGKTVLKTTGLNGVKTLTYEVTLSDGIETSKKLIKEEITTQPINEVITIGTKVALNCPNGTYTNTYGNEVCRPFESPSAPEGATARCDDGTYSFSQSRRGTCSHHGGVAQWL